jgi:hypothetical protein
MASARPRRQPRYLQRVSVTDKRPIKPIYVSHFINLLDAAKEAKKK